MGLATLMKRNYLTISLFFIVFLTWIFSVQYSDAQINAGNSSSSQNQNGYYVQPTVSSGILNIASVTVNYQMRGGLILNATLDKDIKSIILEVEGYNTTLSPDAYGPHYLELWIPHKLLDTQSRGNFTISINGQVVAADQAQENIEPRWIVMKYQTGNNIIGIIGTRTVYDLTSSANPAPNQLGPSASPTINNPQSTTNNNPFSVELISVIVFAIAVIVAAITLVRSLVNKKARLHLEIVKSYISKSNGDSATIVVELKIHNKGGVRTTIHELACKVKVDDKEIEVRDDNKSIMQVDFHSTAISEPIKFSLSNSLHIDPDSVDEITLIVRHTYGVENMEHVHMDKDDKSDSGVYHNNDKK